MIIDIAKKRKGGDEITQEELQHTLLQWGFVCVTSEKGDWIHLEVAEHEKQNIIEILASLNVIYNISTTPILPIASAVVNVPDLEIRQLDVEFSQLPADFNKVYAFFETFLSKSIQSCLKITNSIPNFEKNTLTVRMNVDFGLGNFEQQLEQFLITFGNNIQFKIKSIANILQPPKDHSTKNNSFSSEEKQKIEPVSVTDDIILKIQLQFSDLLIAPLVMVVEQFLENLQIRSKERDYKFEVLESIFLDNDKMAIITVSTNKVARTKFEQDLSKVCDKKGAAYSLVVERQPSLSTSKSTSSTAEFFLKLPGNVGHNTKPLPPSGPMENNNSSIPFPLPLRDGSLSDPKKIKPDSVIKISCFDSNLKKEEVVKDLQQKLSDFSGVFVVKDIRSDPDNKVIFIIPVVPGMDMNVASSLLNDIISGDKFSLSSEVETENASQKMQF